MKAAVALHAAETGVGVSESAALVQLIGQTSGICMRTGTAAVLKKAQGVARAWTGQRRICPCLLPLLCHCLRLCQEGREVVVGVEAVEQAEEAGGPWSSGAGLRT